MHKSTGFESYAGKRQEERGKDEALTVISYQCIENLLAKQLGRKAMNQVLLF